MQSDVFSVRRYERVLAATNDPELRRDLEEALALTRTLLAANAHLAQPARASSAPRLSQWFVPWHADGARGSDNADHALAQARDGGGGMQDVAAGPEACRASQKGQHWELPAFGATADIGQVGLLGVPVASHSGLSTHFGANASRQTSATSGSSR